ncbi:MAG: carboxynorspermidine decarboxylase, partial [Kiritimatiellaeota bacterium]|nr:carboxynorspermidine decarboxylase [Kiritimatiellota bacterium]
MIHSALSRLPSPCYVLSEAALRKNLAVLARAQEEAGAKIILALKGVAMVGALPVVAEYLPGCAASSLNETLLAEEF